MDDFSETGLKDKRTGYHLSDEADRIYSYHEFKQAEKRIRVVLNLAIQEGKVTDDLVKRAFDVLRDVF